MKQIQCKSFNIEEDVVGRITLDMQQRLRQMKVL